MSNTITLSQLHNDCVNSKEYNNIDQVVNNIFYLDKSIKSLSKQLTENKEIVLDYMEKNGIVEITDYDTNHSIKYVDMIEKLIVDNKRLKSIYNEIYNDCVKVSNVKAHLLVK